ncbi:MAG: hypothetical protein ACK5MN_02930 [Lachnospiraceae bacterium]
MPDPTNLPEGCKFHPRCPWVTEECKKTCCEEVYLTENHYVKCIRTGEIKK